MEETLTQQRRVCDEGPMGCKALLRWEEQAEANTFRSDGTI